MDLLDRVLSDDRVREFWPGIVAALVIAVGHVWLLVQTGEGTPLGLPLFAGIAVFVVLEGGRWLYRKQQGDDE